MSDKGEVREREMQTAISLAGDLHNKHSEVDDDENEKQITTKNVLDRETVGALVALLKRGEAGRSGAKGD